MKKITRIMSYEPEGRVEYHLSENEMKLVRMAVDLIHSSPDPAAEPCDDPNNQFLTELFEASKKLRRLEFPD